VSSVSSVVIYFSPQMANTLTVSLARTRTNRLSAAKPDADFIEIAIQIAIGIGIGIGIGIAIEIDWTIDGNASHDFDPDFDSDFDEDAKPHLPAPCF